jgi:hypothetical protein
MLFGVPDTIDDCINKLSDVTVSDITKLAQNVKLDAIFFVEGTLLSDEEEDDE